MLSKLLPKVNSLIQAQIVTTEQQINVFPPYKSWDQILRRTSFSRSHKTRYMDHIRNPKITLQ